MRRLQNKTIKTEESKNRPFFDNVGQKTATVEKGSPFFVPSAPVIQKQTEDTADAGSNAKTDVLAPTPVALPTFDFKNKYEEFGRFDANYTPAGPVPAEGTLDINLWIHINFENFSAKRMRKEPYKSHRFTKEQLKDFAWADDEKSKFESDFISGVEQAWSNKHKFRLKDPTFSEYLTSVKINVFVIDEPKFANMKITALKIPKGAPRFRPFVLNNEATLEIRDPSETQKTTISPNDFIRQIGPFGFDKADITPELTDQIKEVTTFLKSNPDPDHWSLFFEGRASSQGSKSYNDKLSGRRIDAVRNEINNQMGWGDPGNFISVTRGKENATGEAKFRRVDVSIKEASKIGVSKDLEQNMAAHEAGHMFGLGDEYVRQKDLMEGEDPKFLADKPSHYNVVKTLMGEDAANELLIENNESIMSSGMQVKKGHYVSFLAALNKLTGKTWNVE